MAGLSRHNRLGGRAAEGIDLQGSWSLVLQSLVSGRADEASSAATCLSVFAAAAGAGGAGASAVPQACLPGVSVVLAPCSTLA